MAIDFEAWDIAIDSGDSDKQELFDKLAKEIEESPDNVDYLWRLTKASLVLSDAAEKNKEKAKVKDFVEKSLVFAKKALSADEKSLNAHKWYCASVGRISDFVGTKERIQYGHEFKKHSDIAVAIEPNDKLMHHMYGRWCFEVAGLSWVERKLAATFFGTPPESSYEEAFESLMKADKLCHDWKANQLWIGKVLVAQKKYTEAIKWIDNGLRLASVTEEDHVSDDELKELEKNYGKYRK